MEIEDRSRLVQFLSNWAALGPWKNELRISGNEVALCEMVFPTSKETTITYNPLWKRNFAMPLSKLRGLCRRNMRPPPDAGDKWALYSPSSQLAAAIRAGAKWNELGVKYGSGIALLIKLPEGFIEYRTLV